MTEREEPCQHTSFASNSCNGCRRQAYDIITDLRAENETNRQLSEVRNQQVHELIEELAAAEARAEQLEKDATDYHGFWQDAEERAERLAVELEALRGEHS